MSVLIPSCQLISFAMYRLCIHPEYVEILREEAERFNGDYHSINNEDMPYFDSFLKEVARLHPITVGKLHEPLQMCGSTRDV